MKAKSLKLLLCTCSIFTIIALVGCTANESTKGIEDSEVASTTKTSADDENIATNVFPKDEVIDVKITIDEEDFQSMLDNASAEEMMTASVNYNGVQLDNVGIRTKGNLSLRSVVSMEDSERYSFKLSFDEYISSQTFFGISKINLNNSYSDASYMREYLAYELAEEMGLPTPGYSFVNIYINDELWGFYLAVQQIDDQYLQSNFGNSYGALYKADMSGSGNDLAWIDDNIESYSGLLQKSELSNDDILVDMINELNNGSDYEKYLDVEEALKFIALNVLTNNSDSYLGGNKHNYYLYEDDGVFSILPWDYNMAFGGMGSMGSSSLLIDEPTQGNLVDRPLVAKLLAVDEYKEMYHDILQQATEGYLLSSTFSERVEELSTMISTYVEKDPTAFNTFDEYQNSVTELVTINDTQVSSIDQQLAGTIASSGDGSGSGGGMGMGGGRNRGMGEGRGEFDIPAMAGVNEQTSPTALDTQGASSIPTQGAPSAPADGNTPSQGEQGFPADIPEDMPAYFEAGGFPGGGMGGERPEGMGGGFGGFGERSNQPQGSVKEAITAGIALVIMLLSGMFITFYKRKKL
ncbi:CotH kinase family protein [Paenibacillus crassostreae]|uniref:Spore coat protein CotH n=1 Tax=Paenibacillus crassostreae TaxID=1763538 RepID=A0A167G336_9BACL|nr:CotH kinase family protein [Paenibacillus crassostreae]AOZ93809.1 spore coat protein CotH [Paenibacillus crassostreae]OAB77158.1 spore coat protein CotH [Paenibacillus crassostreae]